jgi:hypothetical protein
MYPVIELISPNLILMTINFINNEFQENVVQFEKNKKNSSHSLPNTQTK